MSYGAMGKGMTLEERKKEMLRQRLRSIEWDPTYPGPFSAGEAKQKAIKEYEDSKQQDSKQL